MTLKNYRSGLIWLGLLIGLPLLLLGTLSLGGYPSDKLFALTTGIFAYVWMLGALFLAGQQEILDKTAAGLAQGSLLIGALPLGLSHANLSPATDWTSLTGNLALVALASVACYSLTYARVNYLPALTAPAHLLTWGNRLNALATGLTFIHVQLITDIRNNLPFMVAVYALTGLAFASYFFGKKAPAVEPKTVGHIEQA